MNLTQIETFLEVAQAGGFSAASRRLSLPPSTVSARIKALEERLGVALFRRTTRKVALTTEGKHYFAVCQEAIALLSSLQEDRPQGTGLTGHIRLTTPIDISKPRLTGALSRFTDQHPSVKIEVIVTDSALDFVDQNIDIALRGRAPGADSLISRRLNQGRLGFFASPDYAAARADSLQKADFSGCVVYDPFKQIRTGAVTVANAITPPVQTENKELCKAMAIQAKGIALLSHPLCEEAVKEGKLIELPFNTALPNLPLFLVMPSRRLLPARVRKLADHLIQENREHPLL